MEKTVIISSILSDIFKKIYPDCMSESKCQNSVKVCFFNKKSKSPMSLKLSVHRT